MDYTCPMGFLRKVIILAVLSCAWFPSAAFAVCTGQFLAFQVCGNNTANQGFPIPTGTPIVSTLGLLGGSTATALPTPFTGDVLQIINTDATASRIDNRAFGANPIFTGARADGTNALPTAVVANDVLAAFNAHGYFGSGWSATAGAAIELQANQTWTSSAQGTHIDVKTTPNGSTVSALATVCRFENDGGITCPNTVTGGDQGAGKINVSGGYYVNGVPVVPPTGGAAGTLLQGTGIASAPVFTATPTLGIAGTTQGTLGFAGLTSGTAIITAQATAGTPTITLPNTSGTLADGASSPLILSATTGNLTCPTCVTGTSGALTNGVTTTSGYTNTQILGSNGSVLLAYSVSGSGNVALTTSPVFVTPTLGAAIGTSVALGGCSIGANAFCITGNSAIGGTETITSTSSSAFAVGAAGATNPAFSVDASNAPSVTGVAIKSLASGNGVSITATDSGASTNLIENAKGTGIVQIGSVSTGGVQLASAGGGVAITGNTTITGSGAALAITTGTANALAVGASGTTNPALQVDTSTASSATGVSIKSAAAGGGVAIAVLSSGTNEALNINAKGSGATFIGSVSSGAVDLGAGGGGATVHNSFTATGLVTFADMATAAVATSSQYLSGASSVLVPASVIYTAETTTTFGATTTFDFSTFINTAVTLTANITTMTLSNVAAGKAGQIRFIQDGTGGRTTVWNSIFKFAGGTTPTLSAAANAIDVLFYSCVSASLCYASLTQNMK